MLNKDEVLKTIVDLPDEFRFDEILDRLLLLDKIERGLLELLSGNVVSTVQAEEILSKWLK
jgi:hypothetical protein